MNIFFAGAIGAEMKDSRLSKMISHRRLVSYHYMTPNLNKDYFGFAEEPKKKTKKKEEKK